MPPTNPPPGRNDKPAKPGSPAAGKKPQKPGQPQFPAEGGEKVVPPADTFFTRYSPNGEVFISPMSSMVIHGLLLGFILLGVLGWLNKAPETEEIEPILIGDGTPGGGGGNVSGFGDAPGNLTKKDDVTEEVKDDKTVKPDVPENDPSVKTPTAPTLDDETVKVPKPKKQDTGIKIPGALEGNAGKGKGGGGRGGGKGEGIGLGNGDKWGLGPLNKRGRRVLRWEMVFRTDSSSAYLNYLNQLQAYVGFPDQSGTRLMVVRNLADRPAKWEFEEVGAQNRIWWTDDREDSARGVAELLQMPIVPREMKAFMPKSIEDELVRVEMEYAKKYGVTKEEDIANTQFNVSFRGGKPTFSVKSQTRK
ncbi:MAG: hypothetical protein ACJ8F7_11870 [Gemmataceae bacterium]